MSQKNLISELSSYYRPRSISTINYEYPMNISTYQNFAIYSLRELNVVNTGSWLLCGYLCSAVYLARGVIPRDYNYSTGLVPQNAQF